MKTMKYYYLFAAFAFFFAACTPDNPIEPEQNVPTAKEKAMVPTMMMWQLDSTLIINYPGSLIETNQMVYPSEDSPAWTYTFYPCTYQFPDDIVFYSDWDDDTYQISKQFNEDYCKYLCTVDDYVISAGYLCYYRDMFTFNGLKQGGWVEFMIRETDTNWDTDVWTCTYDSSVALDGTVEERIIEYYSPVRGSR